MGCADSILQAPKPLIHRRKRAQQRPERAEFQWPRQGRRGVNLPDLMLRHAEVGLTIPHQFLVAQFLHHMGHAATLTHG